MSTNEYVSYTVSAHMAVMDAARIMRAADDECAAIDAARDDATAAHDDVAYTAMDDAARDARRRYQSAAVAWSDASRHWDRVKG